MAESNKFIIETVANLTGLKQVSQGLNLIEKQSRKFSTGLASDSRFVTGSVKQSMTATGQSIEKTTGIFEQNGRRFKVVTSNVAGQVGLMSQGFTNMGKNAKKSIPIVADLSKALARVLIVVPLWTAFRSIFLGVTRLFKSSLKFLGDWEFQMAQIGIVVNKSASELKGLSSELLTLSRNLGISNKEIGEGAKLFAQQGRAMEEILPLMNATAQLSLLTGRSITQSVEDLTAVLKAYNIEARDAITIVDGITNVMLNNAITAGDLASAYKQVASTASTFGVSLNALTGYITAVKTVTRDSGSKIGLTFRTLFTRLTTTSAKAIQDLTQIPLFLDSMGKTTKTITPNLRNLESVIGELASSFNELGTAQQAQLAKLLGGVRRTNQVIALFQNFDQATKANIESLFNFGKAGQAVNILTDTLNLRVKRLAGTWNEFTQAVGDTAPLKSFVSGLAEVIEGFTLLSNPRQFKRIIFLEELNKQQEELVRNMNIAQGFIEAERRAKELQDSFEAGRITSAEVEFEIGLWSVSLAKASRVLGIDFNSEIKTASGLVKELNDRFEDITLAKAELEVKSLRKDIQKDLTNLSDDLRKIGEPLFEGVQKARRKASKELDKLTKRREKSESLFEQIGLDRDIKTIKNSVKELKTQEKFIKDLFANLETELTFDKALEAISIFQKLGLAGTEEGSKLVVQFGKVAKEFDNTGSSITKLGDLTEGFSEKFKKAREEAQKTRLRIAETEATLLEKLFQIELSSIKLNKDNLEVVRDKLSLLRQNEDVDSDRLTQLRETLEKEEAKLIIARERFQIDLRSQAILNRAKSLGASELQIAIQELALAEATNVKYEDRLKLQEKIVSLMQKEELGAQRAILSAVESMQKLNGEETSEALLRTQQVEKRLGLEQQGLAGLKQQLDLAKAIVKEGGNLQDDKKIDSITKRLIKLLGDRNLSDAGVARAIENITDDFTRDSKKVDSQQFNASLRGLSSEDRIKAREGRIRGERLTPETFQRNLGEDVYRGSKEGVLDAFKSLGAREIEPLARRLGISPRSTNFQDISTQTVSGAFKTDPLTSLRSPSTTINNFKIDPAKTDIFIAKGKSDEEIEKTIHEYYERRAKEDIESINKTGSPKYEALGRRIERF